METKQTNRPAQSRRRPPAAAAGRPGTGGGTAVRPKTEPRPKPRRQERVVYTPPKPFNGKQLLLQLGIVAAVALAVFFSLWLFFKVSDVAVSNLGSTGADGISVSVSGTGRYSAQTILEASGIQKGDSLLAINKAKVSGRIITKLPYVKSVRIGIKLPGTVNIEIEELDVVYAVSQADGTWWLMNSEGKLIEKTDAAEASAHTQVLGVYLDTPVAGQQAVAQELAPTETLPEGETQPVTISNGQRLQTALVILQYLEQNNVMGEVANLDVSDMGNIKMQYGDRFDIAMGDATSLSYKVQIAMATVEQLEEHDRGNLDVSFIIRQEVIYTPRAD